MTNKLQQEIENLKKELENISNCFGINRTLRYCEITIRIMQTEKCIEIFKEIIDKLKDKCIKDDDYTYRVSRQTIDILEELKSQLDSPHENSLPKGVFEHAGTNNRQLSSEEKT